jgi:toxin YoeB
MAKKIIIWSTRAKYELRNILEFYNLRNGNTKYSLKLLSEIENILLTISESEFIGRLTSNKKTRVIIMKVYLIFYEINENRIEILSVWDKRQNENKRLEI